MKIVVGKGMYSPVRATLNHDKGTGIFADMLVDAAMAFSFANAVGYTPDTSTTQLKAFIEETRTADIPIIEVDRDLLNPNIFGLPGYIYVEASLSELRRMNHRDLLYMELDETHQQPGTPRHRLCILIYPRYLGYSIEIPEQLKDEEVTSFLTMHCRWLTIIPGMAPHQIELAPGVGHYSKSVLQYTSYPLPESGNSKPEMKPDL